MMVEKCKALKTSLHIQNKNYVWQMPSPAQLADKEVCSICVCAPCLHAEGCRLQNWNCVKHHPSLTQLSGKRNLQHLPRRKLGCYSWQVTRTGTTFACWKLHSLCESPPSNNNGSYNKGKKLPGTMVGQASTSKLWTKWRIAISICHYCMTLHNQQNEGMANYSLCFPLYWTKS